MQDDVRKVLQERMRTGEADAMAQLESTCRAHADAGGSGTRPGGGDDALAGAGPEEADSVPPGLARVRTLYVSCPCDADSASVRVWPAGGNAASGVSAVAGSARWARWYVPVRTVRWECGGEGSVQEAAVDLRAGQWLSVQLAQLDPRGAVGRTGCCAGKSSELVHFNSWAQADYLTSIPFTSGTDGYACFKIPALLATQRGTLLAFAEARRGSCSDFAGTDLVYRRSTDGGLTWSALADVVRVSDDERAKLGVCGHPLVVGNIAPVQLSSTSRRHPGRILAPYTRNNFKTWMVYSDDDGVTWEGDRELRHTTVTSPGVPSADAQPDCARGMTYFGYDVDRLSLWSAGDLARFAAGLCWSRSGPFGRPSWLSKLTWPWQFVGVGPPGSLELRDSGRVVVPGYHSYVHGLEGGGKLPISQLYSNFALGHHLISDDGGDTWRLSYDWGVGQGANENQMVELGDGTVLANSRSLATGSPQFRVQARSIDGGESFDAPTLTELPQPFNGCQGSVVAGGGVVVYVASPDPEPATCS